MFLDHCYAGGGGFVPNPWLYWVLYPVWGGAPFWSYAGGPWNCEPHCCCVWHCPYVTPPPYQPPPADAMPADASIILICHRFHSECARITTEEADGHHSPESHNEGNDETNYWDGQNRCASALAIVVVATSTPVTYEELANDRIHEVEGTDHRYQVQDVVHNELKQNKKTLDK